MNARKMLTLYELLRAKLDVETAQELVLALYERANGTLLGEGDHRRRAFYLYTLLNRTFDESTARDLVELIFFEQSAAAA